MQVLTGKDKKLDSLVDTIVDLMIARNIMVYCIQKKWVVGTGSKLVRGHMVFWHNWEVRIKGYKGRITGGVATILSPAVVEAWRESG